MDKNAIKKYAVWARRELISRVSQKAYQYGIRENTIVDSNADSVDGKLLTKSEKKERQALITQVKSKGFEQVMEEVAYTWFNRFSALRFMEVNGYLPSHVRVFTDDQNNFKPQIITEAIHLELDGLDMDKVYEYKDANQVDELYKYLLITQCNALNKILPGMFQKIADYTELLFPDNLLREGSVIEQMIAIIPESDWQDAVQIIGWLYQYYNTEPKAKVFSRPKSTKISKEEIPAATQLFTPDWLVRYMVENSLGRLWLGGHPNDELKSGWKYYLDEAEQETDVKAQLYKIREEYKAIKPEDIRCVDPCMGSGHILMYMFDVMMQIYESYGYNRSDAAKSIVENNLYGLDIDERATQLAYFAVMMKARQYDRRFFSRNAQPHVYAIRESNHLDQYCIDYFIKGDAKLKVDMQTLIAEMHDAKEYGSILNITNVDFTAMYVRFDEIRSDVNIMRDAALNELLLFVQMAQAMAQKYDVVVTNPPYMLMNNADEKLSSYVNEQYANSKADLYAVFIEKCSLYIKKNRFFALVTMHSWMFTSSFEDFRALLNRCTINNMAHLGARAFEEIGGEVVQTTAFVMTNESMPDYKGIYVRLLKPNSQDGKEALFLKGTDRYFASYKNYSKIIGKPIAYWISEKMCDAFSQKHLSEFAQCCTGMQTGSNEKYVRLWTEVDINNTTIVNPEGKYKKYNCGGESRKWYGNHRNVVLWGENGEQIRSEKSSVIRNEKYYYKMGISWKRIGSSVFYLRYLPEGFIFDQAGDSMFMRNTEYLYYVLAFVNSKVAVAAFEFIAPTMNLTAGNMNKLPIIYSPNKSIDVMAKENIDIAKDDWDSFEISWDFIQHPLVRMKSDVRLSKIFETWNEKCNSRIEQVKSNEQKINEYFIQIYGLQNELSPNLTYDEITINKADLLCDIKSLISYAVGCMFGRYSLDISGLAYAGGDWDASEYSSYNADADNIIPICDDEYFPDDIMGRFVKFIETIYGAATLEENLKFIADALGSKGSSRDVIRNYFMNDFYNDHCKMYQKRPIYWQFDSGKKNGFKALVYLHRYQPDTIARMRTDYVHEQQERYRTAIAHLQQRINDASASERVKLNKQLGKLQDQATEIRGYEEKIHHLADQMIRIDLDNGLKNNYEIFKDVLAIIK